jgi:hypothetical protein
VSATRGVCLRRRCQVRYPIMLTAREKRMAQEVCVAFRQCILGCDLLRTHNRTYVCDVNGWSFVKKRCGVRPHLRRHIGAASRCVRHTGSAGVSASLCSKKYYDDCAHVLVTLMLRALAPRLLSPSRGVDSGDRVHAAAGAGSRGEELRCVVAVFRHGDRTPKQKLKLVSSDPKFASLLMKYAASRACGLCRHLRPLCRAKYRLLLLAVAVCVRVCCVCRRDGKPAAEVKLKTAVQLQAFLDAVRECFDSARGEMGILRRLGGCMMSCR